MIDPIVDEVRRIRDAHAARFKYDLRAIFPDLKEREKKRGLKFVQGVARQPTPELETEPTAPATPESNLLEEPSATAVQELHGLAPDKATANELHVATTVVNGAAIVSLCVLPMDYDAVRKFNKSAVERNSRRGAAASRGSQTINT